MWPHYVFFEYSATTLVGKSIENKEGRIEKISAKHDNLFYNIYGILFLLQAIFTLFNSVWNLLQLHISLEEIFNNRLPQALLR